MRTSGMLLPIASLPSSYGIGSFSKSGYDFVDILKASGQSYWQILPIGPTGFGDSPYQSVSTFAGNPYFIDLDELINEGLLTKEECDAADFGRDNKKIEYEKIYKSRFLLLKKAFQKSDHKKDKAFLEFKDKNAYWLKDFTLYMAVKEHFNGKSFCDWDDGLDNHGLNNHGFNNHGLNNYDIKNREIAALRKYEEELIIDIEFNEFIQFKFIQQWLRLKAYANDNGIKIIGDIPIYVAYDSADTWSNPKLFQLNDNKEPLAVAGCPPDAFATTGQLWGNPLYDWDYHRENGYEWWIKRIEYSFQLYDVVRVDHFRGFDEYYSIPYKDKTAEYGKWEKGPGYELFQYLQNKLANLDIIAEDLGFLTDSVIELVNKTGYPGMKVLEFAFDSREESDYLPHNYTKNCVVYTGTHDNDTIKGWYEAISIEDRELSREYMNNHNTKLEDIHWDFIRLAIQSVADICIIPVQDYLGIGTEGRINVPSTLGNNWCYRMEEGDFTKELTDKIYEITKLYGRTKK